MTKRRSNGTAIRFARLVLCVGIVFALSGCLTSRVSIVNYGIFEAKPDKVQNASQTARGTVVSLNKFKFIEETTQVPAKVGTRFGLLFKSKKTGDVTVRIIHPPTTNPKTSKSRSVESWTQPCKAGEMQYGGFTFDEKWEVATGEWRIQIVDGEVILAEQIFTVAKSGSK